MAEHDNFVNSCCPLKRGPPLLVSGSDDATAKACGACSRMGELLWMICLEVAQSLVKSSAARVLGPTGNKGCRCAHSANSAVCSRLCAGLTAGPPGHGTNKGAPESLPLRRSCGTCAPSVRWRPLTSASRRAHGLLACRPSTVDRLAGCRTRFSSSAQLNKVRPEKHTLCAPLGRCRLARRRRECPPVVAACAGVGARFCIPSVSKLIL